MILESLGCIPSTRAEDKGHGFVNKTVKRFSGKDMRLIISPEGKLEASEWRSGYYHLAKELNASIMVAGLDYRKKRLILGKSYSNQEINSINKDRLEKKLKKEMSKIIPLHPHKSHVTPIAVNKNNSLNAVDTIPLTLTCVFALCLVVAIIAAIWITFFRK